MSTKPAVILSCFTNRQPNSAMRQFRSRPVLAWTLDRLARARHMAMRMSSAGMIRMTRPVNAPVIGRRVIDLGPRRAISMLDGITAASKWSDGWRGGLLQTCHFDRGFHAKRLSK